MTTHDKPGEPGTIAVDVGPPDPDQRYFPMESVFGLQVMTEGGDPVGQISDADLDDQTLAVKSYFLRKATGIWRRLGRVHPTINQDNPDPECDLDYVPNIARKAELDIALCNCIAFGSKNSALVVRGAR